MKHYDSVPRNLRTKHRAIKRIFVERKMCNYCGTIHRVIPDVAFPYKQYEAELISGVVEGLITAETLGFEDYPCESTMKRWLDECLHK